MQLNVRNLSFVSILQMGEMEESSNSNGGMPPPSAAPSSQATNGSSNGIHASGMSGSDIGGIIRPAALTMPPPSSFPMSRSLGKSPLFRNFTPRLGLAKPLRPSRLSAEDDAAVEAAVEIGFLLSQYSQNDADLLLQTLHKEGNLNIFGSSNTPKIGAIGRHH